MKTRLCIGYGLLVAVPLVWDIVFAQKVVAAIPTPGDAALEAAKLVKDWSVWLAGIQTAAIAAIGALLKDGRTAKRPWLLPASLTAFALSLMAAAWLLETLPRLVLRLTPGTAIGNDVFAQVVPFYLLRPYIGIPARMGLMMTYEHMFFLLGVVLFCWMLIDWRDAAQTR